MTWWHGTRRRLLWVAALVVGQVLLAWWLARYQVVAVLLAAGAQTPWHYAAAALGFIALRLLAILGLPGLLLYVGLTGWWDYRAHRAQGDRAAS